MATRHYAGPYITYQFMPWTFLLLSYKYLKIGVSICSDFSGSTTNGWAYWLITVIYMWLAKVVI